MLSPDGNIEDLDLTLECKITPTIAFIKQKTPILQFRVIFLHLTFATFLTISLILALQVERSATVFTEVCQYRCTFYGTFCMFDDN
jgi:hypothetical protein